MTARRFTYREMEAIETALNQCLAGPLDGFDEDSAEERATVKAMNSALAKVQERLSETTS